MICEIRARIREVFYICDIATLLDIPCGSIQRTGGCVGRNSGYCPKTRGKPAGTRPLRTVVDRLNVGAGVSEINIVCEAMQERLVRSMGL